jgi:hypothetical protein
VKGGLFLFSAPWALLHGLPASPHSPPAPLPSAKEAIKHLRKRIAHSNDKVVQLAFMVRLSAMVAWPWNLWRNGWLVQQRTPIAHRPPNPPVPPALLQLLDYLVKNCHISLWICVASRDMTASLRTLATGRVR